jgi:hypothetical protein
VSARIFRAPRQVDAAARIEVIGASVPSDDNPRWVIVNYDLLGKHVERLRAVAWAGVILDEAHFIKNQRAHIALPQAARRIVRLPRCAGRSRPGLSPDRNADDQPAARPLQPTALCRAPGSP